MTLDRKDDLERQEASIPSGASDCMMPDEATLAHYRALTHEAGRVELTGRTQLELRGRDRQRFLHHLCTNDIVRLQSGEGCEAFATNVQGKCFGHLLIYHGDDKTVVDTVPGQAERLLPHWDRYLITEDVQMSDVSESRVEWLVAGPAAERRLIAAGCNLPAETMYCHTVSRLGDAAVELRRAPLVLGGALLLSCLESDRAAVALLLDRALIPDAVQPGHALAALEMARIEAGFPWFGIDISDKNLPQEVRRDAQAISFRKGCYLGQETIARLDALGHVNRMLVALASEVDGLSPASGTALTSDGQVVGEVTSAAFSPRLGRTRLLAYVRTAHTQPGTRVAWPGGNALVVD